MASPENQSTHTPETVDRPSQHSQSTSNPATSSTPVQTSGNEKTIAEIPPATSLFGPFPPAEERNQVDQLTPTVSEDKPEPISPPSDQIQPTTENQPLHSRRSMESQPQQPVSPVQSHKPGTSNNPSLPPLTREKTAPAIGPATDKPTPVPRESETEGPVLYITLLLSSTGARHPYKLDGKYLKKRNVVVDGNNPINMSLYKLKELILRDWREEWETKPSSPESIRLISMGKMLNDKARLSDSGFTNGTTPHIIHMTIKPQEIVDEEDAKMKAGGISRGVHERSPGCRCVIQ